MRLHKLEPIAGWILSNSIEYRGGIAVSGNSARDLCEWIVINRLLPAQKLSKEYRLVIIKEYADNSQ